MTPNIRNIQDSCKALSEEQFHLVAFAFEVLSNKASREAVSGNDRRPSGLTNRAEIDLVTSLHLEEEGAAEPGLLVGVARVTSDGVFNATLWDVMVSGSTLFPFRRGRTCAWNGT